MTSLSQGYSFSNRQQGMVLILVLMIFAFASIISAEISYQNHREVRRTANILESNQLILLAKGGEAFAIQKLLADYAYDRQSGLKADYLTEVWAVEDGVYDLDAVSANNQPLDSSAFTSNEFERNQQQNQQEEAEITKNLGNIKIIIEDLHARYNVNNIQFEKPGHLKGSDHFSNVLNAVLRQGVQLADYDVYNEEADTGITEAERELLSDNLLEVPLEIPPADIVLALKDWIDWDQNSALATGAEDEFYAQRKPPYRTSNKAIVHISELKAIKGFYQEDFWVYKLLLPDRVSALNAIEAELDQEQGDSLSNDDKVVRYDNQGNILPELPVSEEFWGGIKHFVTAIPFPSKINVNTAPSQVLQFVFTPEEAQRIIEGRAHSPYQRASDIFLILDKIKENDREKYTDYLDVKSEYFLATIIAEIDETQITLRSTLYRDEKGQVKVISRDYSGE